MSEATASADVGLIGVGDHEHRRRPAIPARRDGRLTTLLGGATRGVELGGEMHRPVVEQSRTADHERVAFDDSLHAETLAVAERLDGGQRAVLGLRGRGDRTRDRVLGSVLQRPHQAQGLGAVDAFGDGDLDQRHLAGGDGAGLVEHDGVHLARGFEHLRSLDQQAELRPAPRADHQRRRGGQPERARAGDDQHRHGRGERERGALAGPEPEAEGGDSHADDHRHEHAGHAVGETLHRRLAGLRVGDERGDLRQRGVGADLGGAHDQPPARVDGGARDLGAGPDLDRDRLAGEQAHVHGRGALLDDPVGGDLLARTHHEAVSDLQLFDGHAALVAVGVEHGDVLGAELEQRRQGRAGAALGARLEVAPGEDERRHDRRRLQVDLVGAGAGLGDQVEAHAHVRHAGVADEQRVERPQPRGQDADRDERVHRRRAVLEIRPRRLVERPRRPTARPGSPC